MKTYLLVIVILLFASCKKEEQVPSIDKQLIQKVTITNKTTSSSHLYDYDSSNRLVKYTKGASVFKIDYNTANKISKVSYFDLTSYNFTYSANQIAVDVYAFDTILKKTGVTILFDVNTKGLVTKLTWSNTFNMLLKYDNSDNLIEVELRTANASSRSYYFKDFDDKKNSFKDISQYQIIKFLADYTEAMWDGEWASNQFNNNPKSVGYRGSASTEAETGWENNIFEYEYNDKGYASKKTNKASGEKYEFVYR